jgi:hypothetical protein
LLDETAMAFQASGSAPSSKNIRAVAVSAQGGVVGVVLPTCRIKQRLHGGRQVGGRLLIGQHQIPGSLMNTQTTVHPERRSAQRRQPDAASGQHAKGDSMQTGNYGRFWAMVATSTAIGWAAMYLNTHQLDHVFFSWTRVFMALIMGGVMTAVMMLFMWQMYPDKGARFGTLGIALALFVTGLWLVRSQATVDDVDYMRAMIPHHSIAILTSTRAQIVDPRVRKLADEIIEAQKREIAEMEQLIADLD